MTRDALRLLDPETRRWSAARVWSAHQAPYLASALLALRPVVVDQSGTAERARADLRSLPVDPNWHVYLDPEVLASAEVSELGFWLVHQVSHLLRHHADRAPVSSSGVVPTSPDVHQQAWNCATDAEINDDLHAGSLDLPKRAVTPHALRQPDGLTAEQYWDAIRPDAEPPNDNEDAKSGPPPDCGSGCDGEPRPWDVGSKGLGDAERRLVERDVAHRITEHQRRRGDVPAGWQRWADEILEPSVSWRRLLASLVRRGVADIAGRVDFTYRRPSRRASAVPSVILPSLRQPMPNVALVLDTSGSMSDDMLGQCLAEVGGVLRSLGIARKSLRVVCCDAQPYVAQRVLDARDIELLGGGGTDMGAGLTFAAEMKPPPDLVVVLTDGFTPWPARAPAGIRVVVGLLDSSGAAPDWADTVLVGAESR